MQPSEPESVFLDARRLTLQGAAEIAAGLRPLLEQGFLVQVEAGQTVSDVLCRQLGVAEDYLRDRVQTVFLNGKAVDDETTAIVHDGDRLALSAAMPGLAGATLRKGGFFSGLRSAISHPKSEKTATRKAAATITIKLFNMIGTEIGPLFLSRGIVVDGGQLAALWARLVEDFRRQIKSAAIDGQPCDTGRIEAMVRETPRVRLQVILG